ncbi:MAG: hypothetical protein IT373_07895 [Polyangiaceae bacterium]|nr:hypothetical protein [Polyangiaceae bacterium]
MAKANSGWRVLAHGPLEKLSSHLWRVEGELEGMPLKRVMSIARREDGRLVVHNGIALEDELMRAIEAWGEVGFLVVPNGYHRLDAKVFHERYPKAQVLCPSGARTKVAQVVAVHGGYEDFPADGVVSLETLEGTRGAEGAMIVRAPDGTSVVLNDSVFNMPHVRGFTGFVLRHLTSSTGGPRISRVARLFLIKDKRAFAAHLERLAALPGLARVVVSHHEVIDHDPAAALRAVASTV